MPTTHLDKSKSIIKGMSAVRKGAETIIKYFLGHQSRTYEMLDDEQKKMMDNLYPHLAKRDKLAARITRFGQFLFSFFGITYLGVEFSSLFGLLAFGAVFGYVSFAILLAGFLVYLSGSFYQEFFVDRPRNALINEGQLGLAFDSIRQIRDSSTNLRLQLALVDDKLRDLQLQQTLSPSDDVNDVRVILDACCNYIRHAKDVVSEDAVKFVISGILECRDNIPVDEKVVKNEQDQVSFLSTIQSVSQTLNNLRGHHTGKRKTSPTSSKSSLADDGSSSPDLHIHDPSFLKGWVALKKEMPHSSEFDYHSGYIHLLNQISTISTSTVLLEELAHSINHLNSKDQVSFNKSDLLKISGELRSYAKNHPVSEQHDFDQTLLKSSPRPSRFAKPMVDIPEIVSEALYKPKATRRKKPDQNNTFSLLPWNRQK